MAQEMRQTHLRTSINSNEDDIMKLYVLEKYFSYRLPGQHYYNGVMWNSLVPRERLIQMMTFHVKPDDVIVSGYPKSGNTWLAEIVYLIEHDVDIEKSNSIPLYLRVPHLEGELSDLMINKLDSPRAYKSHLSYAMLPKEAHEKRPKIVHIIRDPHDIAVSYYHFYRSLSQLGNYTGTWDEFLSMFMAGYVCCGDWFQYAEDWWLHRNEANVLIVRYEDMIRDLRTEVLRIADFLRRPLDEEQVSSIVRRTSFNNMKKNPMLNLDGLSDIDRTISPFMRKGEVGDWKNYFSSLQLEAFDKLIPATLREQ